MSTKELKIEVPKGYEIGIEKSDLRAGKVYLIKTQQVDQQEFDEFFRCLLNGASKLVFYDDSCTVSVLPTSHFMLYDSYGDWLFDVRTGKNARFWYSCYKVLPLLEKKFGVSTLQLSHLMIPMMEELFGLKGVTPDTYFP